MAIKLKKKSNNKIKRVVKKKTVTEKDSTSKSAGKKINSVTPKGKYTEGIGRRKTAIARVRIYESKGDFIVNDQPVAKYFSSIVNSSLLFNQPLNLTKTKDKFSIIAQINGSGLAAQLDALIHGLSRALLKYDPEFRVFLKKEGFLSRDDRMKETRKIGRGGKARRKRQSPKR